MAKKADAEKKQEKDALASMEAIEAKAREKFAADEAAAKAAAGSWVWDAGSGYYYNEVHR
jgi:hypothetical protein